MLFGVVVDICFKSFQLVKAEDAVHLSQDQAVFESELKQVVVNHVILLVTKVHDQLGGLESSHLHTHAMLGTLFVHELEWGESLLLEQNGRSL